MSVSHTAGGATPLLAKHHTGSAPPHYQITLVAPTKLRPRTARHRSHVLYPWPHWTLLSVLFLLLALLSSLGCSCAALTDDPALPPVQHHVYFSGSHVTSIALETTDGELYATDVVNGRIIHYTADGSVAAVWYVTNPPFYSPTSASYIVNADDNQRRLLYVADSTTARIVKVNPDNGTQDGTRTFSIPSQLWECGMLQVEFDGDAVAVYVVDRYRGYSAQLSSSTPSMRWITGPPPPTSPSDNFTATYLSAMTVSTLSFAKVFVVDAIGDRVLQIDAELGNYTEQMVFPLPRSVTGIQAVCWTWCDLVDRTGYGCLWVMYQPSSDSGRTVIAVSVFNYSVVQSFTTPAGTGGGRAGAALLASRDAWQPQQQQWAGTNGHIASAAMRVIGSGVDSDPFLIYLAEADTSGPGHVIVVRSENGTVLQRYDSMPLVYDPTNHTTHAFNAVAADDSSCTLWLTDADNGGMLVRTAADGTILQYFDAAPVSFTAVVVDYSVDMSSPSLVLLSVTASEWQLWRFHPAIGVFSQINVTSASSGCTSDKAKTVDVIVGGLAVDSTGRLLVSLTSANQLLMMQADGECDTAFNTSDALVRPGAATFTDGLLVVAFDRSGQHGEWYIQSFAAESGELQNRASLDPPVSQPIALMYDSQSGWLWMSDANGLLFQINPESLSVPPGGIYQPAPFAYDMTAVTIDVYGTLYAVDRATGRLIMLFLGQTSHMRPDSTPCNKYPVPSSSTAAHSSSSSSSTGSGPTPPVTRSALLDAFDAVIVTAVSALVALVFVTLVYRQYWVRRSSERRAGAELDDADSDEDQQAAYVQWNEASLGSSQSPTHMEAYAKAQYTGDVDTVSEPASRLGKHTASSGYTPAQVTNASDSRYDAYVRLYEALNEAQGDKQRWYRSAAAHHQPPSSGHGHSDGGVSHSQDWDTTSTEPPLSSSTAPTSSPPSSRQSTRSVLHYSSDSSGSSSGSGSGSGNQATSSTSSSTAAISIPASIARLSSGVVPRFIDEVTDLQILGEGHSGRVYSGSHQGMRVVVKLPKSREMSAAQWREWQAHLRLPMHRNLVRFVGSLVMCDTNYLVLQWVEQGSLASLLNSPTATSTARWYTEPYGVMRAAADIASALHHVHAHGLIHRDVSARNVLVDGDGTFVLADLGLCQEVDTPSHSTAAAHTDSPNSSHSRLTSLGPTTVPLRWCSPEYLTTLQATGRSDVWALGVTLWEMTAGGRLPYSDTTDQRCLQLQLTAGLLRLQVDAQWMERYEQTDQRGLVERVVRLIDTCMTVDVQQRPDAEQLMHVVQQEMAEWETECGEEAERVQRRWADEHAAAAHRTPSAPQPAFASPADEAED